MSVWFEGESRIDCDIERVKSAVADYGATIAGVVGQMPGITEVELVEEGPDCVTLQTNEGLMKRTRIARRVEPDMVVVDCDEEFEAGSRVTATSHFRNEFTASGAGVVHRAVVSDVQAPGLLGFFYRRFGSRSMGKAFLSSYKGYLELLPGTD